MGFLKILVNNSLWLQQKPDQKESHQRHKPNINSTQFPTLNACLTAFLAFHPFTEMVRWPMLYLLPSVSSSEPTDCSLPSTAHFGGLSRRKGRAHPQKEGNCFTPQRAWNMLSCASQQCFPSPGPAAPSQVPSTFQRSRETELDLLSLSDEETRSRQGKGWALGRQLSGSSGTWPVLSAINRDAYVFTVSMQIPSAHEAGGPPTPSCLLLTTHHLPLQLGFRDEKMLTRGLLLFC